MNIEGEMTLRVLIQKGCPSKYVWGTDSHRYSPIFDSIDAALSWKDQSLNLCVDPRDAPKP